MGPNGTRNTKPLMNTSPGSATVKEDGTYDFTNVPPGEYRITSRPNPAHSSRQYAREQAITVVPGAAVSVKLIYE
jgi:hypothetical protein